MKIAIATENDDFSSEISSQGARALYYLIFNNDGHLSEILENPYVNNKSRVGPDVANMLIKINVTTVIAGRFGQKFKGALEENHVECIEQTGFAAQVVNNIIG